MSSKTAQNDDTDFLREVFDQILLISSGQCTITQEKILALKENEDKLSIFAGLQLLHEDLALYKEEYKAKIDTEYKLKVQEKKNEELEQFNYMASHDLKEPLRNVKNFSQLLQKNFDKLSKEKINEYLHYINQSTSSMYKLLDSLLSYSTANKSVDKSQVNLNNTINVLLKDLSSLTIDVEFDIAEMPLVYADEAAIKQVFQNLITNAIKFKDSKRKVHIKINCKTAQSEHVISVEDNGIGIREEYQETIFKLLKRLHLKSEIEGSGVGLSICHKLIELHSGKIWVTSKEGVGSTFHFSLPKKSL